MNRSRQKEGDARRVGLRGRLKRRHGRDNLLRRQAQIGSDVATPAYGIFEAFDTA